GAGSRGTARYRPPVVAGRWSATGPSRDLHDGDGSDAWVADVPLLVAEFLERRDRRVVALGGGDGGTDAVLGDGVGAVDQVDGAAGVRRGEVPDDEGPHGPHDLGRVRAELERPVVGGGLGPAG